MVTETNRKRIHLINSIDTKMFGKTKNLLSPKSVTASTSNIRKVIVVTKRIVLTRICVTDFTSFVRVQPNFLFATFHDRGSQPLLKLQTRHAEKY